MQVHILNCSGSSNVGQLANDGVKVLCSKTKMIHASLPKVLTDQEILPEQSDTSIIALVDGCEKQCVKKLMESKRLEVKNHLVITDLGIEKKKLAEYTEEELQLVIDGIKAKSTPVIEDNMEYLMSKPKCPCFS